jgi:hypothetical protein
MSGFSALQRRLLEGMGYELLQRVAAPTSASGAGAAAALPIDQPAPSSGEANPTNARAKASDSPLWSHILRALGGPPERAGLFLVDEGPALQFDGPRLGLNLDALRRDAEAKRRLWRTLRELRPD